MGACKSLEWSSMFCTRSFANSAIILELPTKTLRYKPTFFVGNSVTEFKISVIDRLE